MNASHLSQRWRDFCSSPQLRRMYVDLGVRNDQIEYHINFTGKETIVGFLEGKIQRILYVYFMMRSNTVAGSTRLSTIPKRWMGEPTV